MDSTNVYFAKRDSGGEGALMKVPIGGGITITLASRQNPGSLTLDSANICWTNYEADGSRLRSAGHGEAVS